MAFDRVGEFGVLSLLIATSPVQDLNIWAQWGLAGLVVQGPKVTRRRQCG